MANPRCKDGCNRAVNRALQATANGLARTTPAAIDLWQKYQKEKRPAVAMKPVAVKARVASESDMMRDREARAEMGLKKSPNLLSAEITGVGDAARYAYDELYTWNKYGGTPERAIEFLHTAARRAYSAIALIKRDKEAKKK